MFKVIPILYSLFSLFLFFSCSGGAPEILEVEYAYVYSLGEKGRDLNQTVDVFVHFQDPDGYKDIETLIIQNKKESWFWTISSKDGQLFLEDNESWIGRSALGFDGLSGVPRGTYLVRLIDRAGRESQREIVLSQANKPPSLLFFPNVQKKEDRTLRFSSPIGPINIYFYSKEKDLVKKISLTDFDSALPLSALLSKGELEKTAFFILQTYDRKQGYSLCRGPFTLRF